MTALTFLFGFVVGILVEHYRYPLFNLEQSYDWNPPNPYWRVRSKLRMWGPWCPSRWEALWRWLFAVLGRH